nr:MAG TPA: hypothetical protein [Caudoviricetes sp.]
MGSAMTKCGKRAVYYRTKLCTIAAHILQT